MIFKGISENTGALSRRLKFWKGVVPCSQHLSWIILPRGTEIHENQNGMKDVSKLCIRRDAET